MLIELGYKITTKGKDISAIKKDSRVNAKIGSNVAEVNGKKVYLSEIIWDVDDVITAIAEIK